jgi:hypothetical protein
MELGLNCAPFVRQREVLLVTNQHRNFPKRCARFFVAAQTQGKDQTDACCDARAISARACADGEEARHNIRHSGTQVSSRRTILRDIQKRKQLIETTKQLTAIARNLPCWQAPRLIALTPGQHHCSHIPSCSISFTRQ